MHIKFTARHFRAHTETKEHAIEMVKKLDKYYDGIINADIVLSYERATKSVKTAEINLHVYGGVLTAKEKSEAYGKSIDAAVEKLIQQLAKYKAKLRAKDKEKVREIQEKV